MESSVTHHVVDLVGAHSGTEAATMARVEEALPDATVSYIARTNTSIRTDATLVHRILDDDLVDDVRTLARVAEIVEGHRATDKRVAFWSFQPRLTNGVAAHFATEGDVAAQPLSRLMLGNHPVSAPNLLAASALSEEEVLDAALAVMASRPNGRVKQVELRTLMAAGNPVFDKQTGPDAWKAPGFVKAILTSLKERGLVEFVGGIGTVNQDIQITDAGRLRVPAEVVKPAGSVSEAGKDDKVQSWWDLLREAGKSPWPKISERLFAALAEIVVEEPGRFTSSELTRKAVILTREASDDHAPWSQVERWLMQLLQIEGVLLAGENIVHARFGPNEPKITGLVPDLSDRLRMRVLIWLVEMGAEIDYTDAWRLSAVLFGTRSREDDAQRIMDRAVRESLVAIDSFSGSLSPAPHLHA